MKWLLSCTVVIAIYGCSDSAYTALNEPLRIPDLSGRPETVRLIKDSWPKLLAHCLGLSKYSSDLIFVGISDMIDPSMAEMSRVEIKLKIPEDATRIPKYFRASGHICGYGISPQGASVRIQKDVCVSVCLGVEYKGPTDYLANLK